MDWLVGRYPISPNLVEFCLVTLAAMVPTVFLLAWFHGKPGPDKWTRAEKIGIPTNVIATAALLIFLFQGRDLGATATKVNIVDEEGQQIERLVPKSEFRKKVLVFPLNNESGNTRHDWWVHALPDMLSFDLSQDIYLDFRSAYSFYESTTEESYPELTGVPMTLKKKIAAEKYLDYFTIGQILEQDGMPYVKISLHETRTAKLKAEHTFSGEDILTMVDEMAVWFKDVLDIPIVHVENSIDLPVSEILTESVPALQHLYAGFNEYIYKENREEGLRLIEQAVSEDTTFAYAYIHLYVFYLFNNQMEESMQALQTLMKYLHKIPESNQFSLKHAYYFQVRNEPEMSLELAKNWAELYPDDIEAHVILGIRYMLLGQKENELASYKKILSLDPNRYDYVVQIANIYMRQDKFDESLEYYQLYAEKFPNNARSFTQLGDLYRIYGDYEEAISYYKKALLIETDDISIELSLARINTELGEFSQALEDYQAILEKCSSPMERYDVFRRMERHFFLRGQLNEGIEHMQRKIGEREKYDAPVTILSDKIDAVVKYTRAGRKDTALRMVQTMEQFGPPLDHLATMGYLRIYTELQNTDSIEKYLPVAAKHIKEKQLGIIQYFEFHARATLFELNGEYDQAIQEYTKVLDMEPVDKSTHYQIGRCYRKMKEYREAEEHLLEVLGIHPCWPEELYELGLVYHEWGKKDKALEYLRRAQTVWEEADPGYEPAIKTVELLAELE